MFLPTLKSQFLMQCLHIRFYIPHLLYLMSHLLKVRHDHYTMCQHLWFAVSFRKERWKMHFFLIPGLMENVSLGLLGFSPWQKSCNPGLGGCNFATVFFFVDCLSAVRSFALQGDGSRTWPEQLLQERFFPCGTNPTFHLLSMFFSHPSIVFFPTPSLVTPRSSSSTGGVAGRAI